MRLVLWMDGGKEEGEVSKWARRAYVVGVVVGENAESTSRLPFR